LFFVYRKLLEMYQSYPEVLLIDCTYKTNRFHMPLCGIMGITGLNTSFFVALAFLPMEQEADYTWVIQQLTCSAPGFRKPGVIVTDRDLALMNALAAVLLKSKHMLCKWHIRKNVKVKCLPFFRNLPTTAAGTADDLWQQFLSDWNAVVGSVTTAEYSRQINALKTCHHLRHFALRYIETVWLRDYRERFVYAWTYQHLHFNTVVTSRVESGHSLLKRYIGVGVLYLAVFEDYLLVIGCDRRPV
jgi:hypothetical protein